MNPCLSLCLEGEWAVSDSMFMIININIIIIIIIIVIIVSFMHGIHTHIPQTNHVPRGYIVAATLSLLFMVPLFLVPTLAVLFFYLSAFRSMFIINFFIVVVVTTNCNWVVTLWQ